jgi:AcrR family transcriptional regulator
MNATLAATRDREADILDAALAVLARDGIGGVSMRAVAREAGVSLGLANYYFTDKTSLISSALRRIGEADLAILQPDDGDTHGRFIDPVSRLRTALHRVADHQFLQPRYLALRLQLWSLAAVDPTFGEISRSAQQRYLDELTSLVIGTDPSLSAGAAARRASEILVIQNGVWLTAAILGDSDALARSIARCEQIALGQPDTPSPRRPTAAATRRRPR